MATILQQLIVHGTKSVDPLLQSSVLYTAINQ